MTVSNYRVRGLLPLALLLAACVGEDGTSLRQATGGQVLDSDPSCAARFDPDRAAAGEDCAPVYNRYCPRPTGTQLPSNQTEVTPCPGVQVSRGAVSTSDGTTSDYTLLTPITGGRSGLYVALHWAGGNGETLVSRMRMTDLALARDLTVVAPNAPTTTPGAPATWGFDLLPALTDLTTRVRLLDLVIASAQQASGVAGPVFVVGLSGGGVMAFEYGCQRAGYIAGVEIVASEIRPQTLAACNPPAPLASVQVHGTLDLIGPYPPVPVLSAGQVPIYERLLQNNGCDTARERTARLPSPDPLITGIEVRWVDRNDCTGALGSSLVTIEGGGHSWPGFDDPLGLGIGVNGYGPVSNGFDATIQGYDLLRHLTR